MEQWQFLIQKEGERTWHPLGQPRVELMEGRYRVVARCHRINTDVEVRVTHSSPSEVPAIRIQRRRRRINSQGLMAVIPFTYLKSGIWELQCSGDLMSDFLGASWQYTVSLVVLPLRIEGKAVPTKSSFNNLDKQHKVRSEEAVARKHQKTTIHKPVPNSSKSALKTSNDKVIHEKPVQKLRESLQGKKTDKQKAVSKKPIKKSTGKLQDSSKAITNKTVSASLVQKPPGKHTPISSNKVASEKTAQKSSEESKATSNKVVTEKPTQKGNLAKIEPTASPVRVKGDTAEQILQNLIELALPSEALILDETVEDKPPSAPPLPLLLTLDKVNYVAHWGETITLEGLVQLKQTTNKQIKQIKQAEVQVELRSPLNSELLKSVRQSNPNKSLPFAITPSIDIPSCCDSKLILGEVKVYGIISNNGILELLACQSFTITAEITELLAITVAHFGGELDSFDYSTEELSAQNTPQILEADVSLDLELFNLAKTAKPEQPVPGVPSTKKSLPPRIDPRMLRTRVATHSLKLPNVPGYQEKINEYINNGHVENLRGSNIRGTSFPYLRKLKALSSSTPEVDEDVDRVEQSTYSSEVDNQNLRETLAQTENTPEAELLVDGQKSDNSFEFEEPITPRNSEFVAAENTNNSPLIRQWMLSQGYSLPEPIDVEYEDYDVSVSHQEISHQQASLAPKTETDDNPQALDSEKAQEKLKNTSSSINIRATSSPYFSISSSSAWGINQITTPSTQIAEEIVVDDTDFLADNILETENRQKNEPINEPVENTSTAALTITTQEMEQLPTPQLYIPQGELISGKSVHVRVRLPQGNSHLAVKLWLEDCQTRYLIDGPHLLTNLTPNNNGELEIITKLNIPFGCLELRLEAIAINKTTQQESHKFTIQRTVIPPDLPNIQFDATLGM